MFGCGCVGEFTNHLSVLALVSGFLKEKTGFMTIIKASLARDESIHQSIKQAGKSGGFFAARTSTVDLTGTYLS